MFIVSEYITLDNRSPFGEWFEKLPVQAAVKVRNIIARMEWGNFAHSKSVGNGVWEAKIDYGPGYRVYYARKNSAVILLLIGGTKKRQQNDIKLAKILWDEFKKRQRREH